MLKETIFHRQLDVLSPKDAKKSISIIGTGAVGSVAGLCLAKIGCSNIKLFDFDKVEMHNIPSQMFTPEQVGMPKVNALQSTIKQFTDIETETVSEKWNGETSQIMIIAVDSMKERKNIYEQLKEKYMVELMIETRMGAENMRIYPLTPSNPEHQKFYEKTLYSDKEASEEICTRKAIAYNTFVIGGLITSIVQKYLRQTVIPKEILFDLKNYTFLSL